jgi:hypothetical protein
MRDPRDQSWLLDLLKAAMITLPFAVLCLFAGAPP